MSNTEFEYHCYLSEHLFIIVIQNYKDEFLSALKTDFIHLAFAV